MKAVERRRLYFKAGKRKMFVQQLLRSLTCSR